jgi:anti-anti-sigma factor
VSDRPSPASPATGPSIGRLSIHTRETGHGRHEVQLKGEIDVASAPMLEASLESLCANRARGVVLDLGGVEFIDSSGLNAILRGRALCQRHDCELILMPAQSPAQRVFEITGVLGRLPFRDQGMRSQPAG